MEVGPTEVNEQFESTDRLSTVGFGGSPVRGNWAFSIDIELGRLDARLGWQEEL